MTAARAVGVRQPYAAVPAAIRAWVEESLGSAVVEAAEHVGAARERCLTGKCR